MNGLSSIKEGDKFGAVCVTGMGIESHGAEVVTLDDELSVYIDTKVEITDHWREWIGSIKSDQIAESDFVIVARRPSAKPDVADKDLEDASVSARSMWEALCVAAIPYCDNVHFLAGARVNGEVRIIQSYSLHPPRLTRPKDTSPLSEADLKSGLQVLAGLRSIRATTEFGRLKRGHRALQMAIRAGEGDDKLHQFVRAIEAIVKPSRANGMRDFGERCSKGFLSGSEQHRELMAFSYDLRSVIEHMGSIEEFVTRCRPLRKVEDVFTQHLYQTEGLATALYSHIFRSKDAREVFRSDDSIDALWSDPSVAQSRLGFHCELRPWPPRAPSFIQIDEKWKTKIRSANARLQVHGPRLSVVIRAMDVQKYNWHDGVEALRVKLMVAMASQAKADIPGAYLQLRVNERPCDYGDAKLQWSCHKGWKHDRSESDESMEVQADTGTTLGSELGLMRLEMHFLKPFVRPLEIQLRFGSDQEAMHGPKIEIPPGVLDSVYDSIPFGDSQHDPSPGVAALFAGSLPNDAVVVGPAWPERT